MSDKRSNLVNVGRVAGAFGVKGWLKVTSNTEPAENILQYSPWWVKTKHGVKAMKVDDHGQRNGGLTIHFEGVDDRDDAVLYTLCDIAVERSQFADLDAGEFYWHQLIGLNVVSEFENKLYNLGQVKNMLETGANDVFVVAPTEESIDGNERLVPYVPDVYVKSISLEEQKIVVEWDPEF